MGRYADDSERADRLQLVDQTHLHAKALHLAAEEALKYHDKYVAAMAEVMSCLLDNSDCMEKMRRLLGEAGQSMIAPTYEATGAVAAAFETVKASVPMKAMRDCLCKMADVSTVAKRNAKVTRTTLEEQDVAARKYAKRAVSETPQKLANVTAKKREKVEQEHRTEEARLVVMDARVLESLSSLCGWWAERLAGEAEELYAVHRHVGLHLTQCYADTTHLTAPPPSVLPQRAVNTQVRGRRCERETEDRQSSQLQGEPASYGGVSDYLSAPPTELRGRPGSSARQSGVRLSSTSPPPPPPLYAAVEKEVPPTVSAPLSESTPRSLRHFSASLSSPPRERW